MIINLSEAKTQLSKLVDMIFHGEKIVIAKNNLPMLICKKRDLISFLSSRHGQRLLLFPTCNNTEFEGG